MWHEAPCADERSRPPARVLAKSGYKEESARCTKSPASAGLLLFSLTCALIREGWLTRYLSYQGPSQGDFFLISEAEEGARARKRNSRANPDLAC